MGGVTAIFAVSLSLAESALAINLIVSNPTGFAGSAPNNNIGQSFINDPTTGTGATIFLNDWTFAFSTLTTANAALFNTLSIYSGGGNGGTLLASSTNTQPDTFAARPSVRWTFLSGVSLVDNLPYTAVIQGATSGVRVSVNNYTNGTAYVGGTSFTGNDLTFQGNFSATPVPFEFEASGGLAMLGAGWLLRKRFQKK